MKSIKILCPVDFSETSLNACRYALQLGELIGASMVELTHCSDKVRDRNPQGENEGLLEQRLFRLKEELKDNHKLKVETSLFKGEALDVYPPYIKAMDYDLVVVGTKGLTPVRDMTIGSFTEDLIFSLECPILVVPTGYRFAGASDIVLALDGQPISDSSKIQFLTVVVSAARADLHIVHVNVDDSRVVDHLSNVDHYLQPITYNFESIELEETLTKDLEKFCLRKQADFLCMVHRDRGWLINIFHKSMVKEELFHLEIPLLVLPE